jgi:tight adherence protein C
MSVLIFLLLKKTMDIADDLDAKRVKRGKPRHLIYMIATLIFTVIVGNILTGSLKTGFASALIILIACILEKSAKISRRNTRRIVITRELPLLLDFLVMQVESGHSILQAFRFSFVLFPEHSPVHSGLLKFEENVKLGASVQAALEEMGCFLNTTGSKTALLTISLAMKYGTPIGEVLRNQANRMREQLVIEGEKFANTLSIKLLIPLLFFIFPASFLVIFSPVIVSLTKTLP